MKTLYTSACEERIWAVYSSKGKNKFTGSEKGREKMPESSEMGRGWRENLWIRLTLWPKQPPNFNLLQEHLFTSYRVIWVLHGCCKLTAFLSLLMGSSGISLGLDWLCMASHFGPQPLCSHGGEIHCTYKTAWKGGRTNRSLLTNDIIYYYCLLFYYKYLLPSYERNTLNIFPKPPRKFSDISDSNYKISWST